MQSIKLLFFLAVWKRPEITEICFMGLNRLKKTGKFPMEFLAVISEEEMIPLCEMYGVEWVMHENLPLGRKKNFGLQQALKRDFDYLIELGSDDLLKNELLDLYAPLFEKQVPLIGMQSFAFINSEDMQCRLFTHRGSAFGIGRAIRRNVIETLGAIWPDDRNSGLDNASRFKMVRSGFFDQRVNNGKPLGLDIKSEVNIWKFNYLQGSRISFSDAVEGLSEQEIEAIKALQKCQSLKVSDQ
jgi:hypothetical protein